MTDDRAIELFVRDGNHPKSWGLVDEVVRLHYRLKAAEEVREELARQAQELDMGYEVAPAHGVEPRFTGSKPGVLPLDEAG